MPLFSRTTRLSEDATRYLRHEASAYRGLAQARRQDAQDAPTPAARDRILGRARDADRTARQLDRKARRR